MTNLIRSWKRLKLLEHIWLSWLLRFSAACLVSFILVGCKKDETSTTLPIDKTGIALQQTTIEYQSTLISQQAVTALAQNTKISAISTESALGATEVFSNRQGTINWQSTQVGRQQVTFAVQQATLSAQSTEVVQLQGFISATSHEQAAQINEQQLLLTQQKSEIQRLQNSNSWSQVAIIGLGILLMISLGTSIFLFRRENFSKSAQIEALGANDLNTINYSSQQSTRPTLPSVVDRKQQAYQTVSTSDEIFESAALSPTQKKRKAPKANPLFKEPSYSAPIKASLREVVGELDTPSVDELTSVQDIKDAKLSITGLSVNGIEELANIEDIKEVEEPAKIIEEPRTYPIARKANSTHQLDSLPQNTGLPRGTRGLVKQSRSENRNELWKDFAAKAPDYYLEAIQAITAEKDPTTILNQIARKQKMMTHLLIDNINELALDILGQNILISNSDEAPFIIEEYKDAAISLRGRLFKS